MHLLSRRHSKPVRSYNALQLSGMMSLRPSEPMPQQLRATPLAVRAISDHRGLVEKDPSSVSPMSRTTAVPCTIVSGRLSLHLRLLAVLTNLYSQGRSGFTAPHVSHVYVCLIRVEQICSSELPFGQPHRDVHDPNEPHRSIKNDG